MRYNPKAVQSCNTLCLTYIAYDQIFNRRVLISTALFQCRYEKYKPAGVNDQCYTDVVHTIRSFYINKPWAIESMYHTS